MVFKRISDYLAYVYLQYELLTALYMLEPWEKKLFNSLLVVITAMSTYTTYLFLPRYTKSALAYFGYDLDGT